MIRLLAAITTITLLAAAAPARAGKAGRELCADDVTRFCAAAGKKRKAIRACLIEHRSELSDGCRLSIDKKGKTAKSAAKPEKVAN